MKTQRHRHLNLPPRTRAAARSTLAGVLMSAAAVWPSLGCQGDPGSPAADQGVAQPLTVVTAPGAPVLVAPAPVPEYHVNPATGTPDFLTFGPAGLRLPESGVADAPTTALAFFRRYPNIYGTADVDRQLRVVEVLTDPDPPYRQHVVLQQIFGGVPVHGGMLRVHLAPGGAIRSVSGIYVHNPGVDITPSVAEQTARATAETLFPVAVVGPTLHVLPAPLPRPSPIAPRPRPGPLPLPVTDAPPAESARPLGLRIFPTRLATSGATRDNLVWAFSFPRGDVFVDAHSGQILAGISNEHEARRVLDNGGAAYDPIFAAPRLVMVDGNVVAGAAPPPDAQPADVLLASTIGLWATLGRSSWDGRNADASVVVNPAPLAGFAMWNPIRNHLAFSVGAVTGDIMGHEFAHAVIWTSSNLLYLDEPGALNEHYADVFGNLTSPDVPATAWMVGEGSSLGAIRNMANPGQFGHPAHYSQIRRRGPGCTGLLDPLTNRACDMGNVHSNSGIGNRAAVLLSDGDGAGHAGIGRARLGRLFAEVLTRRLHPWSTYLDELHNTWEAARDLAHDGTLAAPLPGTGAGPFPFDPAMVHEVLWAFNQVGVDRRLQSGWFQVGGGLVSSGTLVLNGGKTAPAFGTVTDVELVVRAIGPGGLRFWEGTSRVSTGGSVSFGGGLWSARIIAHGVGTASEEVTVAWTSFGFIPLDIAANAFVSIPPPEAREFLSPARVHWSDIPFAGGKGDETVSAGTLTGGADCVVTNVQLELMDNQYNVRTTGGPGVGLQYGRTGGNITSHGIGTRDLSVGVHWWFDAFWAVRYQVRYTITGHNCNVQ